LLWKLQALTFKKQSYYCTKFNILKITEWYESTAGFAYWSENNAKVIDSDYIEDVTPIYFSAKSIYAKG